MGCFTTYHGDGPSGGLQQRLGSSSFRQRGRGLVAVGHCTRGGELWSAFWELTSSFCLFSGNGERERWGAWRSSA